MFTRRALTSRADVHRLILEGLPASAAESIVASSTSLSSASVLRAIGMSLRTLQRGREAPARALSVEQSDRAWRLSELLGNRDEAERWFTTPELALDQQRPIDLMALSSSRLTSTCAASRLASIVSGPISGPETDWTKPRDRRPRFATR